MTKQTITYTLQEQKWAETLDINCQISVSECMPRWLADLVKQRKNGQSVQQGSQIGTVNNGETRYATDPTYSSKAEIVSR